MNTETKVAELTRLCHLSGMPEKLSEFIEQGLTVEQASEALLIMLANPTNSQLQDNPLIQSAKLRQGGI